MQRYSGFSNYKRKFNFFLQKTDFFFQYSGFQSFKITMNFILTNYSLKSKKNDIFELSINNQNSSY